MYPPCSRDLGLYPNEPAGEAIVRVDPLGGELNLQPLLGVGEREAKEWEGHLRLWGQLEHRPVVH